MNTPVWRSPGRVNLIGEHTDYNEGFCLPLTIAQGCTATVTRLTEPVLRVSSAQRAAGVEIPLGSLTPGVPGGADSWAAYAAAVIWALGRRGHQVPPVAIHLDGNVPPGAGLSSSAALECAVVAAVCELSGIELSRSEWVSVARQAENDYVGSPTGGMDQLASVHGEAGHALLCDMRSLTVTPIPLDLHAAGLSLLVIDSNVPHQLTDAPYADRRAACEQAAEELGVSALRDVRVDQLDDSLASLSTDVLRKRARHVITENARTIAAAELLAAGRLADVGPLLTASHASLRDDFEVSVRQVDLAVEVMLGNDALGARMTGGGFGGCAIALIDTAASEGASTAVTAAFAENGFRPPKAFLVEPAGGTHRLTVDSEIGS